MIEIGLQLETAGADSLLPFAPSQTQAAAVAPDAESELQVFLYLVGAALQDFVPDAIPGERTPLPATPLQAQECAGIPLDRTERRDKKNMDIRERATTHPEPDLLPVVIASAAAPLPTPVLLPWAFSMPSRRVADILVEQPQENPVEIREDRKLPPVSLNQEPITFAARLTDERPVGVVEETSPAPELRAQKVSLSRTIQTEKPEIGFVSQNRCRPLQTPAGKEPNEPAAASVQDRQPAREATVRPAAPALERTNVEPTKRTQAEPGPVPAVQAAPLRQTHAPAEIPPQAPATAKPHPIEPALPVSRLMPVDPPAPATVRSAPVREISLRLPDRNGGVIEVQILERDGKVNVIVRAPDTTLSNTLRAGLTELVRAVHEKGYEIETWTPPETRPHFEEAGRPLADVLRGDGASTGSGNPRDGGGQNGGNPQQRRQQQRPEWLLELERRLQKEG